MVGVVNTDELPRHQPWPQNHPDRTCAWDFTKTRVWVRLMFVSDRNKVCIIAEEPPEQRWSEDEKYPSLSHWLGLHCLHEYSSDYKSIGYVIELDPQDGALFKLTWGNVVDHMPEWIWKS